jgi:hypothetical protein
MVVFGPNQIWSRFGFDLNFKFNRAHSSASSLLCLTHCCRHSAAHCCHLSPRRVPATLEHPGCHSDDDVIVRHTPPPSLPSAEALSPLLRDPTCGALKCRPNALKMEQTTHPPPLLGLIFFLSGANEFRPATAIVTDGSSPSTARHTASTTPPTSQTGAGTLLLTLRQLLPR